MVKRLRETAEATATMQDNELDEIVPEAITPNALEATPAEDSAITGSPEQSDQATSTALDRKLAKENQSLRKRLRDLETEQKAIADAELTETERLKRQVIELTEKQDEVNAKARTIALRAEITSAANKFGIVDVDAASRLIDMSALDYDDADGWIGVEDALRALTHDRPWLVSTAAPTGSAANPTNPPRRRTSLTAEQLRGMTPNEIAALPQDEVNAALAGQ